MAKYHQAVKYDKDVLPLAIFILLRSYIFILRIRRKPYFINNFVNLLPTKGFNGSLINTVSINHSYRKGETVG